MNLSIPISKIFFLKFSRLFFFQSEQFVLRVHEGPVETPQLWREVTINKKTTVRDVIVSMKNDADWSDLVLFLKIFFLSFYLSTNQIKNYILLFNQ